MKFKSVRFGDINVGERFYALCTNDYKYNATKIETIYSDLGCPNYNFIYLEDGSAGCLGDEETVYLEDKEFKNDTWYLCKTCAGKTPLFRKNNKWYAYSDRSYDYRANVEPLNEMYFKDEEA